MTGAIPIVDSSDRSIRPQIRMKAWASTSKLSSEDCWMTLIRFSEDRNTGETMNPITISTRITGTKEKSLHRISFSRFSGLSPASGPSARSRCLRPPGAVPCRSFPFPHTFHGGDEFSVGPPACECSDHTSVEQGEYAVADP